LSIRKAALADSAEILSIYAPYVTDTCITFETEVPTIDAFTARIENIMSNYPCLVYEENGKILGYAYASKHRERAAYQYSADVSVYVDQAYHRRGIGKALYAKLLEILMEQGRIYTAYAGIALPNEKSVGLHKTLGFKEVGIYHNVGYKFSKWIDVIWLEKSIRAYD
jgi:phosphinothricin acetyltransferase